MLTSGLVAAVDSVQIGCNFAQAVNYLRRSQCADSSDESGQPADEERIEVYLDSYLEMLIVNLCFFYICAETIGNIGLITVFA